MAVIESIAAKILGGGLASLAEQIRLGLRDAGILKDPETERKAMEIIASRMKDQANVIREEISSPRLWISGWRPAFCWMIVAVFGFNFIGIPAMKIAALFGGLSPAIVNNIAPVQLPGWAYVTFVSGFLGYATLRTIDKKTIADFILNSFKNNR